MLIILSVLVLIVLFLQTFFLGGTVWLGILGMLLCLAGIILSVLLKKKENIRSFIYPCRQDWSFRLCAPYGLLPAPVPERSGKRGALE